MNRFIRTVLHHLNCNIAWSYPHFVDCTHQYCGNWKQSHSWKIQGIDPRQPPG